MSAFWQTTVIPTGETRHWQISLLDLWIHHGEGEWKVWHKTGSGSDLKGRYRLAEECREPKGSSDLRVAFDRTDDDLTLEPAFPDRSIVSYPGSPVVVPARSEATFICGIPLWLQFLVGKEKDAVLLATLPLRHLSKTWFGTALEGEPCYSASTAAVQDHRELAANKYRALCPVKVTNRTRSPLPINRICIHVEHLQLLEGSSYLWTNEVYVRKDSEHEISRVSYGTGAPANDPEAVLKLGPRVEPPQSSLIQKTFNHLRTVLSE